VLDRKKLCAAFPLEYFHDCEQASYPRSEVTIPTVFIRAGTGGVRMVNDVWSAEMPHGDHDCRTLFGAENGFNRVVVDPDAEAGQRVRVLLCQ
jgi:hypothetical protein